MSKQQGPEKIGTILRDWFETSGLGNTLKHLDIYAAWEEVVGPAIRRHTRIAGLAHHKLYVNVDSAAHLQELRSFYKGQLLRDLKASVPGVLIHDIVFRAAPLDGT